jgi:hypothetical protein
MRPYSTAFLKKGAISDPAGRAAAGTLPAQAGNGHADARRQRHAAQLQRGLVVEIAVGNATLF